MYCATPKDLARYLRGRVPTVTDIRSIRATIDHLEHHSPTHHFFESKQFFSTTHIYGLSEYGARYAREIMGIDTARAFEIRDLEHEHLLTLFHIHLREFAARHKLGFTWKQELVDYKKPINPDAIATLTSPAGTLTYLIEPERQSFSPNLLKKAKKYFEVFGKPEAKKLFGAEKFRVIFVLMTERKRQSVLEKFAAEYPYKMFWLTTTDLFQKDMGGEIFSTPKDSSQRSYSFLSP